MPESEPLVSVIIPTYNRAELVPAAVRSVLEQSYRNIEVIVVDDGSADDTRKVLEPFRNNLRYLFTKNSGPAHARNTGMKAARGEYIAFLDSDDLYLPYKIELQVSFMETHGEVGMVCTEVSGFNNVGFFEEYHLKSFHQIYKRLNWAYEDVFQTQGEFTCASIAQPMHYYIGDIFRHVLRGPVVISTTMLFPRRILGDVGYQNEGYRVAEEYEMVVRICKRYKVGFINHPTYLYRYHGDQISEAGQPWTEERALTWIEVEKVVLQALLDWGIGDKEYYYSNSAWLNDRAAELYHCIGEKWLEYGDEEEARKCFRQGLAFDHASRDNRQCLVISFLPRPVRRMIFGMRNRVRRLTQK
jgi:glycosyltransferase involved in cell wall biosynthesis